MDDYIKRDDAMDAIGEAVADGLPKGWYLPLAIIPSADVAPVEMIAEIFGGEPPCNFGFGDVWSDDVMLKYDHDWCENNCGKVPPVKCWLQFFKAWGERKDNDR